MIIALELEARHRGMYFKIMDVIRKNGTPDVPTHCGCAGCPAGLSHVPAVTA